MKRVLCATILILAFAVSANVIVMFYEEEAAFLQVTGVTPTDPIPWIGWYRAFPHPFVVGEISILSPEYGMHCGPYRPQIDGNELWAGKTYLLISSENPVYAFGFDYIEFLAGGHPNFDVSVNMRVSLDGNIIDSVSFEAPDGVAQFLGVTVDTPRGFDHVGL